MSPDELSRRCHSLQYAIQTLSVLIGSKKNKGKGVKEEYVSQLAQLEASLAKILKMLEEEKSNSMKQRHRWVGKINALRCDAKLDEALSDELKERIISGLNDLAGKIEGHEDS